MASQPVQHAIPTHPPTFHLRGPGLELSLGPRTLLMGILNVTPDSFSDGGLFLKADEAIRRAEVLAEEGADLIDIGGESSRPGADSVPVEEEIRRVVPVIESLAKRLRIPISIDTMKAEVARRALAAGARIVNDISALRFDPEMGPLVAREGVPVVLMHMQGTPKTMQAHPMYTDVILEIRDFFETRVQWAERSGISRDRIVLDPGIGFGKTTEHNLEILSRLAEFGTIGRPLLIGPSRKSFIGQALGLPVAERLEGTAAAVAVGVLNGASIIRVHDVRAMVRVVRMVEAMKRDRHA
ncbi:MAG TPA: dihydropteroate synthase [Nitrospiria bacterium]|nr:dihydropteroate synthase [Nitrospiria bacterium]